MADAIILDQVVKIFGEVHENSVVAVIIFH